MLAAANSAGAAAAPGQPAPAVVAAQPPSWREGVISLIHKGKGLPRDLLSSYRPLTLLNCDYNIVTKAIANRLQQQLDWLVDDMQTAFIRGRRICHNVLHHLGLAQHMASSGQACALVILDFEKAYDRVDRAWVMHVADRMGCGPRVLALSGRAV